MSPVERLALSRERLRVAMQPPPAKPPGHFLGGNIGEFAKDLMSRIKSMPGLGNLLEPIEAWWARHPLRTAGQVAAEASRSFATPMAERHPVMLLFGAVLVGALLALSRPWRWLVSPAVVAGLLPSLASRAIRELPVDSWLKVLASISAPATAHTPPG